MNDPYETDDLELATKRLAKGCTVTNVFCCLHRRYRRSLSKVDWTAVFMVLIILVTLIGIPLGVLKVRTYQCKLRTQDMNVVYRYRPMTGCMVQVEDNKWIPIESFDYLSN